MLRDLAASGEPTTFLTLTADPARYESIDDAAASLVKALRNLRQRAIREGLTTVFSYLAVFEEHKSGWPHLHVLARCSYLPQEWISDRMREYTGGYICWVSAIKSRRIASRYVAKYVSKGPGRYEGCKRYWRSQDYQLHPLLNDQTRPTHDHEGWYHPRSVYSLADSFSRLGWQVQWDGATSFAAIPTPDSLPPPMWDAWIAAGRSKPRET